MTNFQHIATRKIPISYKIWFLLLSLFSFLTFYYFSSYKTHIFHWDEYHFVRKGYYFDLFFVKKDFDDSRWYSEDDYAQPKVGPYLYGLALHLNGFDDLDKTFQEMRFHDFELENQVWWKALWSKKIENVPRDLVPILEPIWIGRTVAILFALGAIISLAIFSLKMKGIIFSMVASGLLGVNSLMLAYGRRAMTDSMQLFFFFNNLLICLFLLKALKVRKLRKTLFISVLLGVNLAQGVGVKISGILMFIFLVIFFLMLFILFHKSKKKVSRIVLSSIITFSSFFVIFIASHPYLYRNTVQNFISMFTNRVEAAYDYQLAYPGSAVYSRENAIEVIVKRTLLPSGDYANFKLGQLPTDLLLFALGILLLAKKAISRLRVKEVSGELLLGVWTAIVMVSLVFYLKNNWPRYFLPTVSVIVITQAYAITTILQTIWAPLKKYLVASFEKNKLA